MYTELDLAKCNYTKMIISLLIENFLSIQFVDYTKYSIFQLQRQKATLSGDRRLENRKINFCFLIEYHVVMSIVIFCFLYRYCIFSTK